MSQLTILCVDNDKHVLELLSFNLQSVGFTVITATTAAEVLTASYCADLILLDPLLPDIDGLELIKRFKSAGITAPIIILSVRDDEVDKVLAFELGADDYVIRGRSGGYLLTRSAREIKVIDILNAVETSMTVVGCLKETSVSCPRKEQCKTLPLWVGLKKEIVDYLSMVTLQDIVDGTVPE